jgi:hypothetical protein
MMRRTLLDRRIRFLVVCLLVVVVGMGIEIYFIPHYVATFTVLFYAFGLQAMRHLYAWGGKTGPPATQSSGSPSPSASSWLCSGSAMPPSSHACGMAREPVGLAMVWPRTLGHGTRSNSGQASNNSPASRWSSSATHPTTTRLTNGSTMEPTSITPKSYGQERWIPADNKELIDYYRDRKVWLVQPDSQPPTVFPYPLTDAAKPRHALSRAPVSGIKKERDRS